jgi:hypothetical protein
MTDRIPLVSTKQRWLFAGILLGALLLRLYVALGSTYQFDEEREWIPFARSISFDPDALNLPIRAIAHPILPAYFIKVGSVLAGDNPLGYRLMSILAGVAMIAVVGVAALRWAGFTAAAWAMGLLAFNEYHIYVSTLAIDKPFQLLFCALAVSSFMRFLRDETPRALYVAGAMTGLGFMCKETTVLLLPAFLACMLLSARHRVWFKRAAPYAAVLIFGAVISPDVLVNLFLDDELQYGYSDHLDRAAGIGFTRHHLLFFFRDAIAWVYSLRGEELYDLAPEYASMNSALGLIMFGVATAWLLRLAWNREARSDAILVYLPLAFWAVLGFFLVIDVSAEGPIRELVYVAWFWVDLTLIPAALMAGAFLASLAAWRQGARHGVRIPCRRVCRRGRCARQSRNAVRSRRGIQSRIRVAPRRPLGRSARRVRLLHALREGDDRGAARRQAAPTGRQRRLRARHRSCPGDRAHEARAEGSRGGSRG